MSIGNNKISLPSLDGIRAVASWMVVLAHTWAFLFNKIGNIYIPVHIRKMGVMGVTIFFTLSGCLITFLLLYENYLTKNIDLKKFYIRRILRIWPLYFIVIGFGLLLSYDHFQLKGLLLCLFFLSNIAFVFKWYPSIIDPIWSIGVEEQFYLFHPLLVKVTERNRLIFVLVSLILLYYSAKIILPIFLPDTYSIIFNNILYTARFDCMWLGAISGIILFNSIVHKQSSAILIGNYARNTFIVIIIIYITCVLAGVVPFYHILLSISVGGLLINISNEQYKINVLNKPFFKHLGQISYGVYLLHMFPLFSCREIVDYFHSDSIFIIFMLLAMVITTTYIMAYISYHFLEKPFLRLKDKFAIIKRHKD